MSPFDPFRGEGRQKGTMSPFFTVFLKGERPLVRQRKDFVPAFGGFPPLPPMEWSASIVIVIVKVVKGS